MGTYIRNNAWNSGGDFSNTDLLWYAKGVGRMMDRPINDPTSWWFFAAIHGEYANPSTPWYPNPPGFPAWDRITSPPSVPTTPLPDQATQDRFWNQCQHGSWFFPPWHRGYLIALEAQLRADIAGLGGPGTWALPYWNYFGGTAGAQASLPPAFAQTTLPDGSPNPLFVAMRYGPDANGTVFIPTTAWAAAHPNIPKEAYGDVSDACMQNDVYTGHDVHTSAPGFGGPQSGFAHNGSPHGNMESNPHDLVHVYTGGQVSDTDYGLMADPGTAALDPIFYLHHCNIDRMWAVWNASGNANPGDSDWLNGPSPSFVMPMPGGTSWTYAPKDVESISRLDYTYQEMTALAKPVFNAFANRLQKLGANTSPQELTAMTERAPSRSPAQLLGASATAIRLTGADSGPIPVTMAEGGRAQLSASLNQAKSGGLPDDVYLKLEGVRGTVDAGVLGVYVSRADEILAPGHYGSFAGTVGLFGLRRASVRDGVHGGAGLTLIIDITQIADGMHLSSQVPGSLVVRLIPRRTLTGDHPIEVGRVSVYRQSH